MCIFLHVLLCFLFFFFFKQKTAYELRISDWSSDVCSSDLQLHRCDAAIADPCGERFAVDEGSALTPKAKPGRIGQIVDVGSTSGGRVNDTGPRQRSEERRVGKEGVSTGRTRGSPYH